MHACACVDVRVRLLPPKCRCRCLCDPVSATGERPDGDVGVHITQFTIGYYKDYLHEHEAVFKHQCDYEVAPHRTSADEEKVRLTAGNDGSDVALSSRDGSFAPTNPTDYCRTCSWCLLVSVSPACRTC